MVIFIGIFVFIGVCLTSIIIEDLQEKKKKILRESIEMDRARAALAEEYRQAQYEKKKRLIEQYLQDHGMSPFWTWGGSDTLNLYPDDNYGIGDPYRVYFKTTTVLENEEIFAMQRLEPPYAQVPFRSKDEKKKPQNKRVHKKQPLLHVVEKEKFNPVSAKLYISGIFQQKMEDIIKIGNSLSEDETTRVYAADFYNQKLPNRKELKIMAAEFRENGFEVRSLNYKTGEFELALAE